MPKLYISIVLVSFVVLVLASAVQGRVSCIRCESSNNERCGVSMTQEDIDYQTKECDDVNENICMKTKVQAMRTSWTSKNGKLEVATVKVSRFCGKSSNYPWVGCYFKNGKAGDSWVCACTDDNCNSSTTAKVSLLVLVCSVLSRLLL